jgi:hypothetical protein
MQPWRRGHPRTIILLMSISDRPVGEARPDRLRQRSVRMLAEAYPAPTRADEILGKRRVAVLVRLIYRSLPAYRESVTIRLRFNHARPAIRRSANRVNRHDQAPASRTSASAARPPLQRILKAAARPAQNSDLRNTRAIRLVQRPTEPALQLSWSRVGVVAWDRRSDRWPIKVAPTPDPQVAASICYALGRMEASSTWASPKSRAKSRASAGFGGQ